MFRANLRRDRATRCSNFVASDSFPAHARLSRRTSLTVRFMAGHWLALRDHSCHGTACLGRRIRALADIEDSRASCGRLNAGFGWADGAWHGAARHAKSARTRAVRQAQPEWAAPWRPSSRRADTASFRSREAIECGLAFFGAERRLFATDMPFDPSVGPDYIRSTLAAIQATDVSDQDRRAILSENTRRRSSSYTPRPKPALA